MSAPPPTAIALLLLPLTWTAGPRVAPLRAAPLRVVAEVDSHGLHAASFVAGQRPPQPETIVTIMVPVTMPWTDTGVRLATGDSLEIRAWGRATFDSVANASTTPRGPGQRGGGCTFVVTDAQVPAHSVVANVAAAVSLDGRGFFVGSTWKGTLPVAGTSAADGRLLLGFNGDGVLCDRTGYDSWRFGVNHAGWFTAEVAVTRAHDRQPG